MRSLRARIFLTVWPLFVVMILAVGVLSTRSARVELALFEKQLLLQRPDRDLARLADRVAAVWPVLPTDSGRLVLQRLSQALADSVPLLVLNSSGRFVASSDGSVTAGSVRMQADGRLDFTRMLRLGRERQLQRLMLDGFGIVTADRGRLGYLYVLPDPLPRPSGAQLMVAGVERSLWLAVSLACVVAAVGTWLLLHPMVAQVQRLSAAAHGLQAKALSTRVAVTSRDELGALETSFNRMAESLEQAEGAKRQLISDLAHELRTPLTNVVGLLEAMRDGVRPADAATLRSTHEEALLLAQLIDELQALALADAGGWRFDIYALDAIAEVEHAVDAFQASTSAIQVDHPASPLVVQADPRRLAQVLRNVLQNAITHTPADGRITVSLQGDGPWTLIQVTDTGRGIPAAHLPLIWDRFYRVDASRDRATGGMGLGLALTKRLVEGMGGSVDAASTEGVGTTITLRLRGATDTA